MADDMQINRYSLIRLFKIKLYNFRILIFKYQWALKTESMINELAKYSVINFSLIRLMTLNDETRKKSILGSVNWESHT